MTSKLNGTSVLVTGGAGFIGSHLVSALLDQGVSSIRVLDNLVNGKLENLEHVLSDGRLTVTVGDVRDRAVLSDLLGRVDTVFHLACLGVRHSLHDPVENHSVNAGGTLLILELSRIAGVRRFIHVSSSEVFGTAQYAPMDEKHPTWPETVYGASKLAGEAYARAYYRTYGMPTVVVRPFNTYGPRSHFEGDSGEVLPRSIVRTLCGLPSVVFGDGLQTRDFTHVTDAAAGLVLLADSDAVIGQTVNMGFGSEVTINRLCEVVAHAAGRDDLTPRHLPARPGDVRRLLVDATFMHSLTGFTPTIPFEEGVSDLVEWFRTRPSTPAEMLAQIEEKNWLLEEAGPLDATRTSGAHE